MLLVFKHYRSCGFILNPLKAYKGGTPQEMFARKFGKKRCGKTTRGEMRALREGGFKQDVTGFFFAAEPLVCQVNSKV